MSTISGQLKFILIFMTCVVLIPAAPSQTTLFLKPGPEGKDAMVHSYLEFTNLGQDPSLIAAAWTYQGNFGIIRTLISFDLSSISCGSEIESADLSFFYNPYCGHVGHGGDNWAWIRRITENWNEGSVIWPTQPAVTFMNQVSLPPSITTNQDYIDIDVTNLVQDMIDDPDHSFGFQLRMQTEEIYRSLTFASSDHSNSDWWPEIEIIYSCHVYLGNDTILCDGDTLFLDASECFTQYSWSTGASGSNITITTPGQYWVTVHDGNDCEASDTINVEFYPDILDQLNLGADTTLCFGEELLLEAGDGFESYLWQNGSNDSIYLVQNSGLYWVTVTSPCGSATDSIQVDIAPEIIINLGNDTILCIGDSILLCPGNGFSEYLWNTGSSGSEILVTTSGDYWVVVSDLYGCQESDTINVLFSTDSLYQNPLGPDTSLCFGDELLLSLNAGFDTYLWQNGSTDDEFLVQYPGLYWVTITSSCGTVTDSVYINYFPEINLELGNDTLLCEGASLMLDAGYGFSGYLWSDGTASYQNYVTEQGLYSVEVWDMNNCHTSDEIYISYHNIDLDLGNDTMICPGNSIEIMAGDSFECYIWNDTASFGQSFIITDLPGLYWVEIIDSVQDIGCQASDTIVIGLNTVPSSPALQDEYSICEGDTLMLNAGVGSEFYYLWDTGSEDSLCIINEQGEVTVWVYNACDTVAMNIDVNVNPVPEVSIILDSAGSTGSFFHLTLDGIFENIFWSTGSDKAEIVVANTGLFWVQASNEFGCNDTDTINIEPWDCDFTVPLVFTPNGDDQNPVLKIDYHFMREFLIVIVDRWGKGVYESDDPYFNWDGTSHGKNCADGVYYWIIKYNCTGISGKEFFKKGSVTILR